MPVSISPLLCPPLFQFFSSKSPVCLFTSACLRDFLPALAQWRTTNRATKMILVADEKSPKKFTTACGQLKMDAVGMEMADRVFQALGVDTIPTVLLYDQEGRLQSRDGCSIMTGYSEDEDDFSDDDQCAAQTRAGHQCSRYARPGEMFCSQHAKMCASGRY